MERLLELRRRIGAMADEFRAQATLNASGSGPDVEDGGNDERRNVGDLVKEFETDVKFALDTMAALDTDAASSAQFETRTGDDPTELSVTSIDRRTTRQHIQFSDRAKEVSGKGKQVYSRFLDNELEKAYTVARLAAHNARIAEVDSSIEMERRRLLLKQSRDPGGRPEGEEDEDDGRFPGYLYGEEKEAAHAAASASRQEQDYDIPDLDYAISVEDRQRRTRTTQESAVAMGKLKKVTDAKRARNKEIQTKKGAHKITGGDTVAARPFDTRVLRGQTAPSKQKTGRDGPSAWSGLMRTADERIDANAEAARRRVLKPHQHNQRARLKFHPRDLDSDYDQDEEEEEKEKEKEKEKEGRGACAPSKKTEGLDEEDDTGDDDTEDDLVNVDEFGLGGGEDIQELERRMQVPYSLHDEKNTDPGNPYRVLWSKYPLWMSEGEGGNKGWTGGREDEGRGNMGEEVEEEADASGQQQQQQQKQQKEQASVASSLARSQTCTRRKAVEVLSQIYSGTFEPTAQKSRVYGSSSTEKTTGKKKKVVAAQKAPGVPRSAKQAKASAKVPRQQQGQGQQQEQVALRGSTGLMQHAMKRVSSLTAAIAREAALKEHRRQEGVVRQRASQEKKEKKAVQKAVRKMNEKKRMIDNLAVFHNAHQVLPLSSDPIVFGKDGGVGVYDVNATTEQSKLFHRQMRQMDWIEKEMEALRMGLADEADADTDDGEGEADGGKRVGAEGIDNKHIFSSAQYPRPHSACVKHTKKPVRGLSVPPQGWDGSFPFTAETQSKLTPEPDFIEETQLKVRDVAQWEEEQKAKARRLQGRPLGGRKTGPQEGQECDVSEAGDEDQDGSVEADGDSDGAAQFSDARLRRLVDFQLNRMLQATLPDDGMDSAATARENGVAGCGGEGQEVGRGLASSQSHRDITQALMGPVDPHRPWRLASASSKASKATAKKNDNSSAPVVVKDAWLPLVTGDSAKSRVEQETVVFKNPLNGKLLTASIKGNDKMKSGPGPVVTGAAAAPTTTVSDAAGRVLEVTEAPAPTLAPAVAAAAASGATTTNSSSSNSSSALTTRAEKKFLALKKQKPWGSAKANEKKMAGKEEKDGEALDAAGVHRSNGGVEVADDEKDMIEEDPALMTALKGGNGGEADKEEGMDRLVFKHPMPAFYQKQDKAAAPTKCVSVRPSVLFPESDLVEEKTTHFLYIPCMKRMRVPLTSVKIIPCLTVKRIPTKKYLEVPYWKEVDKEYTVSEVRPNTRWVKKEVPSKYMQSWKTKTVEEQYYKTVEVKKTRKVRVASVRYEEVDGFEVVTIPETKAVSVTGSRVQVVPSKKVVEIDEVRVFRISRGLFTVDDFENVRLNGFGAGFKNVNEIMSKREEASLKALTLSEEELKEEQQKEAELEAAREKAAREAEDVRLEEERGQKAQEEKEAREAQRATEKAEKEKAKQALHPKKWPGHAMKVRPSGNAGAGLKSPAALDVGVPQPPPRAAPKPAAPSSSRELKESKDAREWEQLEDGAELSNLSTLSNGSVGSKQNGGCGRDIGGQKGQGKPLDADADVSAAAAVSVALSVLGPPSSSPPLSPPLSPPPLSSEVEDVNDVAKKDREKKQEPNTQGAEDTHTSFPSPPAPASKARALLEASKDRQFSL